MSTFRSALTSVITDYLALKRALGRQYAMQERMFVDLDHFLAMRHADLTAETLVAWCLTFEHLASGVRRAQMREVRNLCLYRQRREPKCFVPDQRLFPPAHQVVRPHLFTDDQIRQLLDVACRRTPTSNSPLCPDTMRLAIVLLYTTGMRRGELVRLTVGDYDPRERTLSIRASKFHKSRVIPVSGDADREITRLFDVRRHRRFPLGPESPLLWHRHRGYSGGGLGCAVRALLRQTAIRTMAGTMPRLHDFRHTFALTVLLCWYRSGRDVHAKLPFLAHYMGHVSIASTAYYLQFIEPLAAAACARFGQQYGRLITSPAAGGDR